MSRTQIVAVLPCTRVYDGSLEIWLGPTPSAVPGANSVSCTHSVRMSDIK